MLHMLCTLCTICTICTLCMLRMLCMLCTLCMLQAFTPIATMVGLFVAGLETPTKRLILAVLLIAIGTAIASYGEVNLSWIGVACMMASETFEATRLVMTQILLVGLKFHPSK